METPDRYCYGYEGSEKVMICFDEVEEEIQEETNQRTNFFPYCESKLIGFTNFHQTISLISDADIGAFLLGDLFRVPLYS